jgi:hypothetical protein
VLTSWVANITEHKRNLKHHSVPLEFSSTRQAESIAVDGKFPFQPQQVRHTLLQHPKVDIHENSPKQEQFVPPSMSASFRFDAPQIPAFGSQLCHIVLNDSPDLGSLHLQGMVG